MTRGPTSKSTTSTTAAIGAVVTGALAILVSGWVHFYLYFRGGYRGIAPDEVLGMTISHAFAINAIAAVVIAELLVLSLVRPRLLVPAAAAGIGFAAATLVAYFLSRARGVLGFEETATTTEAVVGMVAEIVAIIALGVVLDAALRRRRQPTVPDVAGGSAAA